MLENAMPDYLPFRWYINPPGNGECQTSRERILGTFAIINTIVTALSIFSGHQTVVRGFTCGLLGGNGGKPWRYMWLFPLGLQLLANYTVAKVMKTDKSYTTHYEAWELMLFYTARPRMAFVALAFASRYCKSSKSLKEREQPWISSFMSNMIAEVILQLISLYTMGQVVHYGAQRNYYLMGTDEYDTINSFTHLFYAGALYYLVAGCLGLVYSLVALYTVDEDSWASFFCAGFVLFTTWIASWLFWVGFVHAAGDNYCPPNLTTQLLIWSGFSAVGVLLGAGP